MKKFLLMVLVMSVMMAFAGMSVAAEAENVVSDSLLMAETAEAADLAATTSVVGEDIVIGEGEMKIVSLPEDQGEGGGTDAVAPDELVIEELKRVDAANEGVSNESVSNEGVSNEGVSDPSLVMAPVDGEDASVSITAEELSEQELQELADLAAQSGVVGEGVEIAEGEAKIVSLPDEAVEDMATTGLVEEKAPFNWPLAAGIAGGVVVLGGVVFLIIKKSKMTATAA